MRKSQSFVLIIVCVFIVFMTLYPPFVRDMGGGKYGCGHSFITKPPEEQAVVNTNTLLIQYLAVLMVGGISWVLLRGKKD